MESKIWNFLNKIDFRLGRNRRGINGNVPRFANVSGSWNIARKTRNLSARAYQLSFLNILGLAGKVKLALVNCNLQIGKRLFVEFVGDFLSKTLDFSVSEGLGNASEHGIPETFESAALGCRGVIRETANGGGPAVAFHCQNGDGDIFAAFNGKTRFFSDFGAADIIALLNGDAICELEGGHMREVLRFVVGNS